MRRLLTGYWKLWGPGRALRNVEAELTRRRVALAEVDAACRPLAPGRKTAA